MRLHLGRLAFAIFTFIAVVPPGSIDARAANLDEACGGADAVSCNSALWCRKQAGQCNVADAPGICERAPGFCMRVSRPVCGCNGKTYPNECEARHAKMQVDHVGACQTAKEKEEKKVEKKQKKKL